MSREKRFQTIISVIADEFGVDESFVNAKSRKACYTNPRKMMCYLLHKRERMSLVDIAQCMDYKDHTTPRHHITSVKGILQSCDDFKWRYEKVSSRLADIYSNISSKAGAQLVEEAKIKARNLLKSFAGVTRYKMPQRVLRENVRILCDECLNNLSHIKPYMRDEYTLFWTVVKEQVDHI